LAKDSEFLEFPLILKISDYTIQIFGAEAAAEELISEPFAIEAQAESLSSPVAVKLV
jgi:hypothetical protein